MRTPRSTGEGNRVILELESLEDRIAPIILEFIPPAPAGALGLLCCATPSPPPPPPSALERGAEALGQLVGRLAGEAGQIGPVLTIALLNPDVNTGLIVTDGAGDVAVAWNGDSFQVFQGVNDIEIYGLGAVNVVALDVLGPVHSQLLTNVNAAGLADAVFTHAAAQPANAPLFGYVNPIPPFNPLLSVTPF